MFDKKQKAVRHKPAVKETVKSPLNPFIAAALGESKVVATQNGGKAYSELVDNVLATQFVTAADNIKPRDYALIAKDMQALWAENPENAVKFAFYCRMISRKVQYLDGTTTEEPQKGLELKHEGMMRLLWLEINHPETYWKNVELIPIVGSWKDIFNMLTTDLVYNGWENRKLNWLKYGQLIVSHLGNPNALDLIKKYLPNIRSKSACKTIEAQSRNVVAKWVCALLFDVKPSQEGATYKKYRKLKTSGTAHQWQQLISQGKFKDLDFGKIHGRALSKLVNSKFLFNHELQDVYSAWVGEQTVAGKTLKYTGFVHELFKPLAGLTNRWSSKVLPHVLQTIDGQFNELVAKTMGSADVTSLIVVRDTSGSMNSTAKGSDMNCYDIAKALALFFSIGLKGQFSNSWIEFSNKAVMRQWTGSTATERWLNDHSDTIGNTDFQTVIDLFITLKQQGVPESEFPKGILCISDGEFDRCGNNTSTQFQTARNKMSKVFSDRYMKDFVIVLWDLKAAFNSSKFQTSSSTVPNTFYYGGYSASTISLLTGTKITTQEELVIAAMSQEILSLVKV